MHKKIVIAHRGASGYLPEHSMEAKVMAHTMNTDFIEQDVVMTKDNRLVVLHDHFLDSVTNVATIFPQRARDDGRFYVIDFTLDEIRSLRMTEVFTASKQAVYPDRFPLWQSTFKVHTLEHEIELIQGLNKSTGKNIGIYPEIKSPAFHRFEGKDISLAILRILKHYGYDKKHHAVYLQCFDENELKRIKYELFQPLAMQLKLVQLIAETSWRETCTYIDGEAINYDYGWMFKPGAMEIISDYADAVGPWYAHVVSQHSTQEKVVFTHLVDEAHRYNLPVHPYTFRRDNGEIPVYAKDFEELLDIFYVQADVDGVFTDFPDLAVEFLNRLKG